MRMLGLGILASSLIVGCAAGGDASPTPGPLDRGPVPADLFAAMVSEAAEEAQVEESEVSVVTAEAVTWPDGSIGCPEPGMFYTQALVPGYRVILSAGGREFHFHASRQGNYVLCPAQRVQPPAPGTDT